MIRTSNGRHAFDDLQNYLHQREADLRTWFRDATRRFGEYNIPLAALAHIEYRMGRPLGEAEALAVGWCVGVLSDLIIHMDQITVRGGPRHAMKMAWEDGVVSLRNHYVQRFIGLHPQVVAQFGVALDHIDHMSDGV